MMSIKVPNWPLTKLDQVSIKRIFLNWIKSLFMRKNKSHE